MHFRRTVWELKPTFPRLQVPDATMEFTLQLIVKRRLEQGFSIAYGANGIVSMIRQVDSPNQEGIPRIQQCVVFGPILTETDLLPPIGPYVYLPTVNYSFIYLFLVMTLIIRHTWKS